MLPISLSTSSTMVFEDQTFFQNCLLTFYLIGLLFFIALQFIDAPYGKYYNPKWGPTISASLAWFLFESPSAWLPLLLFPFGQHATNLKSMVLMSPFLVHYFHRTLIYPLRLRSNQNTKPAAGFPVGLAFFAVAFNLLNAYLQARWVSHYKDYDSDEWFWWRFSCSSGLFLWGMWINIRADKALIDLKKEGGGYQVPRGGWFELVSCPNYFGELIEWLAWAIMTWSLSGLGFFLFSCANLVPRARANHKWYLEKFEDYPKSRKSVIPFLY